VGEVVCSKRWPFFAPHAAAIVERLTHAGKQVILSTPAMALNERELGLIRDLAANAGTLVEANDVAALSLLAGQSHIVGPYINVYNEETVNALAGGGGVGLVGCWVVAAASLRRLASGPVPLEVQVFGRAPLAISVRCYHARIENLHKDGCRFVCEKDPDGLAVNTIERMPFLAVNGVQTLSHACLSLATHMQDLCDMGLRHFRLSPHMTDMVKIASIFQDLLTDRITGVEANTMIRPMLRDMELADGFYRALPGATPVDATQSRARRAPAS
jgi:collagenase-like PrtC family protease